MKVQVFLMLCWMAFYSADNLLEELIEELARELDLKMKSNEGDSPDKIATKTFCNNVGLTCKPCSLCHPYGLCITTPMGSVKCVCEYGRTGPGSYYYNQTEGMNRVIADNCDKKCYYTRIFRNPNCVLSYQENLTCNKTKCESTGRGKCVGNQCLCHRGWTSSIKGTFDHKLGKFFTNETCDKECPDLGFGIPNPQCLPQKILPSLCHKDCGKNDGRCDNSTGRCICVEGWTGMNARFEESGHISTSNTCDVYCPYTILKRNMLCVNPGYIERSRLKSKY
ncbi:tenascin isoform X2 [Hydra vulgaris]|uniref:Tenascin isoform X2 n=1 Tax=Hydra vulgaris TaxID=6087 RepID=A0ABM4DGN2_HYDVU